MKKDVIYIDIEDDITAVIDKLKASKEKIIALVPPKGNAVLQSIVNLKLLKRAADSSGKQPVVVTSNQALTALAGGIGMYVAKTLQTKPSLPNLSNEMENEISDEPVEVSEGLNELDNAAKNKDQAAEDNGEVELNGAELAGLAASDTAGLGSEANPNNVKKDGKKSKAKKIPNFDKFRKKLIIGCAILLVIIIALLAIFGKTKAKVTIQADTTPVDVSLQATIDSGLSASDPANAKFKAIVQQNKQTLSQSFTPSQQKNIGQVASGSIKMSATKCGGNPFQVPADVPAGSTVSANGATFTTQSDVSFSGSGVSGACYNYSGNSTQVTATQPGDSYNVQSNNFSVSGRSDVSASGSTSGGTTNIVKVVSQSDVDTATKQLQQQNSDQQKAALEKAFGKDVTVLTDTFIVSLDNVQASPAVGAQGDSGTVTAQATYTILGISNDDLNKALDIAITNQMSNKDQQRVYDNGLSRIQLTKINSSSSSASYKLATAGQYGPQFDTDSLKKQISGKKVGEVTSILQGLPGVKGVDVKLSPFWANTTPNPSRIQIKLDVDKNISLQQ